MNIGPAGGRICCVPESAHGERPKHAAPNRVLASGQRVPRSIKVESARLGPKLSTARLPASPADVAAAIDIDGPASDQLGERLAQKHGGDTDIEDINADLAVGLHSADAGPLAGERIEHVNPSRDTVGGREISP